MATRLNRAGQTCGSGARRSRARKNSHLSRTGSVRASESRWHVHCIASCSWSSVRPRMLHESAPTLRSARASRVALDGRQIALDDEPRRGAAGMRHGSSQARANPARRPDAVERRQLRSERSAQLGGRKSASATRSSPSGRRQRSQAADQFVRHARAHRTTRSRARPGQRTCRRAVVRGRSGASLACAARPG